MTYAALAAVPTNVALMGLLTIASGLGLPAVLTCVFQLVDRLAPVGTTTEAFAWLVSAFLVGSSVGAALAGRCPTGVTSVGRSSWPPGGRVLAALVATGVVRGASAPRVGSAR